MNEKIGNYVIFYYDYDEKNNPIIIDEVKIKTFDEALEEVTFSWGLPFKICKVEQHPFVNKGIIFKTVARSLQYAQL